MSLPSGRKLGPYEINAGLGAGGMGEVYRARDTRLGREVAIKILPELVASDMERLQRFELEARSVASLNHPNIMSVHDIGTEDGIHYIVTELLEGGNLRGRLFSGAIPLKRAIDYAQQIAHGLAAAHEKNIVHRDLKPENLFITKDDRVKILDFGLAKQTPAQLPVGADTPTVGTSSLTSAGVIVGTTGYMSPEQIKGEQVDTRTDIFAFGCVVYEMLSGRRAFQRTSSMETMAAILKEEPPELGDISGRIPVSLERILLRCLEKEPGKRFQSAKDLSFALENVNASVGHQPVQLTSAGSNPWRALSIALTLIAIAAVALGARGFFTERHQPRYRQINFRKEYVQAARFAPDGQSIVYAAIGEQPIMKLYASRVDGTETRQLELPPSELMAVSTKGDLAITPAGKTWLMLGGSRLARASFGGGAARELLDDVAAADWSPESNQLAVAHFTNGKCRLEYPIGTTLYESVGHISHMRFSPQGDAIAFLDHPILGDDRGNVVLVDLKSSGKTLTGEWEGTQGLAWSPNGDEIWFTASAGGADEERSLYAVNRSGKQREILRIPGSLQLEDIAPNGRVLLAREYRKYEVVIGRRGSDGKLLSFLEILMAMSVSRDGNFAVLGDWLSPGYNAYLAKLDGSPPVLLGPGTGGDISPDDKWVTSIPPGDTTKVLLLPTGVGETRTISAQGFHYRSARWTNDGQSLVVRANQSSRAIRVWVQDVAGGVPRAITPEAVDGLPVNVNHSDYVSTHDQNGTIRLYSVQGGEQKTVSGIHETDQVIGGARESDFLYVTPDFSAIPLEVLKVNIRTGARQPFISISPKDPSGIVFLETPIFASDEKQLLWGQLRASSILYIADGLK